MSKATAKTSSPARKRDSADAAAKNRPLVDDIRLLGRILGEVIHEKEGRSAFELVERVRLLSVAYRLKRDAQAGRALGFRRRNILVAFLLESLLLSLVGGMAGLALASFLQFYTVSTMNWQTFSELAFTFSMTSRVIVEGLLFSLFMGLAGGFLPAIRAARLDIVEALRSV